MNRKFLILSALAAVVIILCVRWLDYPLAFVISRVLIRHRIYFTKTEIPDLLLPGSVLLAAIAWISYFYCRVTGRFSSIAPFVRALGIVTIVVYVVKEFAQYFFGRAYSRSVLVHPGLQQFRLFHENVVRGGFPSGHMMIATSLLLTLSRFFPSLRPLWLLLGIALGVALVITDYHFLGDVLSGVYLGFFVERIVAYVDLKERRSAEPT